MVRRWDPAAVAARIAAARLRDLAKFVAKRILGRIWRIEEIKKIWYDELLEYYPATALPLPPLVTWPWGRREWESDYRAWRDAVQVMVHIARAGWDSP